MRLRFQSTSSAVKSRPEWNFTPCMSFIVSVRPSPLSCQLSASSGWGFRLTSYRISGLKICWKIGQLALGSAWASKLMMSDWEPMVRVPPVFAGPEAAAEAGAAAGAAAPDGAGLLAATGLAAVPGLAAVAGFAATAGLAEAPVFDAVAVVGLAGAGDSIGAQAAASVKLPVPASNTSARRRDMSW